MRWSGSRSPIFRCSSIISATRPYPPPGAFDEVVAFLLQNLTHVHTIPRDGVVASRLSGIRPGQLVHLRGVLVDAVAPSRTMYRTSLQLFDYDCEIMWVDSITLE